MLSLTYTSSARVALAEDDIAAILLKSRANNRREGVTGALLYRDSRFVQILEGPEEVVRSRFAIIAADPRHRSIEIIREIHIPERQFPEWTMGFRRADSAIGSQLPGYDDSMGHLRSAQTVHADSEAQQYETQQYEAQQYLDRLKERWLPQPR